MPEPIQNTPATVPDPPEAKPPLRKGMPVVIALVVIIALIGLANISSLVSGNKKAAPASVIPTRPAAPNAQQVTSFETQQQLQARRDAEERQRQQELSAAIQQLQEAQSVPGPEAADARPMTTAQRAAIYGDSPNAPDRTSEASQAQAEAKQKQLAKEKQEQDAINSGTLAIDFEHPSGPPSPAAVVPPAGPAAADVAAARRPSPSVCRGRPTAKNLRWLPTTLTPMRGACIASSRGRFLRESLPITSTADSADRLWSI
jgi:hypothetical protein